jgi:myo-inositol 2-dehydrogenase/D-chiro-inositol 1-dehydrogenase
VIGVGRIGTFHARVLAAHEAITELLVMDVDGARAEEVARACGGHVAPSADALLDAADAVVIAAPTSEHARLIHRAIDAGRPAFCEKPIAIDLASTIEVVEHTRRNGAVVQMGFQRRFDAGYRRARDIVANGNAGRIYVVRMAGHDPQPPHESYIPASGGIFCDLHIHDFDIARFVTGQEVTEVYADGAVLGFEYYERYGDVDTAVAVLRFSGGTLGILSGTRHDPLGYDIRMEVFGSADSFVVGADARTPLHSVEVDAPPAPTDAYANFLDRFAHAYHAELHAFVNLVAGKCPNPCPPEDALEAMRVAVACNLSRHEHRPVRLEEMR